MLPALRRSGSATQTRGSGAGGYSASASATTAMAATVRAQPVSTKTFERRMEGRRVEQAKHADLSRHHAQHHRMLANTKSDDRVDTMRRMKRFQQQNEELRAGYAAESAVREEEQRRLLAAQDAKLAEAMADMKSRELAKETHARRVCEGSEEIQELKAQLKAAHMNKVRATQLAERDLMLKQEATRHMMLDAAMLEERRAAVEGEAKEAERRRQDDLDRRSVLHEQMAERQRQKQAAYEAFVKEKAMVDEVVRGIEKEDAAKSEQLRLKQRELQENIRTYLEERTSWRLEEKARAEAELAKIKAYADLQQQRHDEMMAKKRLVSDSHDALLTQLTREIEAKRREQEEYEKLLYELYQEEAEAKAAEATRAREEKVALMRREMHEANEFNKALKAQRAIEQKREEEEFRAKMMAKFEDEHRLEQMSVLRRKREMADYKREVERLVEERKAMYAASVEAELAERTRAADAEAHRKSIVEAERQRLLREHATELKEHLPKGVFKTSSDYHMVHGRPPSGSAGGASSSSSSSSSSRPSSGAGGSTDSARFGKRGAHSIGSNVSLR